MPTSYAGYYSDGRSAERRDVRVQLDDGGLTIMGEDGTQVAAWPYRDLRLVEEVYQGQPVRLTIRKDKRARLTVNDTGILNDLKTAAPKVGAGDRLDASTASRALAWAAATVAVLVGIYVGLPYLAKPVARLVPVAWEEAWGKAVAEQALTLFGAGSAPRQCTHARGQAALDALTGRLAATIKSPYRFRVRVVDSKIVNAFAAPGGHIVIFRGLIDKAKSAEEVAGVLAHEMGHVIEQHSTEAVIRAVGMSAIFSALIGDASSVASEIAGLGNTLVGLSYGRAAEAEADRVGIRILNRANIAGTGFAGFFERISGKRSGSTIGKYLSTHPPGHDRAKAVAQASTGTGPAMTDRDWTALRTICSR